VRPGRPVESHAPVVQTVVVDAGADSAAPMRAQTLARWWVSCATQPVEWAHALLRRCGMTELVAVDAFEQTLYWLGWHLAAGLSPRYPEGSVRFD